MASLCYFFQRPVTSFLSDSNIPLSTLFSNTLILYSSLTRQTKITGKIYTSAYFNPFGSRKTNDSEMNK